MTEFKDALDDFIRGQNKSFESHPFVDLDCFLDDETQEKILSALRIADRLMQEPSSGFPSMKQKGASAMHTFVMHQVAGHEEAAVIFKAMRDQMLAEIDNADGDGM